MNFSAFVEDIKNNNWNVFGVEVYNDGELVHVYGDTNQTKYPIYSATKTITSIAAGIAYDDGKFKLDKIVLDYLPEEVVKQMTEQQIDTFKNITIHRLLTMSVDGFPFRPEGESYLKYSLSCPIKNPESRIFHYNNISAYLVGVALTHAIQEDLFEYINRKVLIPLGIIEPICKRCPDGYFYGASGMEMTVHDLSQIALLLYNGGVYNGKRILSEEYVKIATSNQQMNKTGGYGYFIWKYKYGYNISGKWKQKAYILPERKLIVTYLSHIEDDSVDLEGSMEKHILGIV